VDRFAPSLTQNQLKMKKVILLLVVFVGIVIACTKPDSAKETDDLYGVDKDKICVKGNNCPEDLETGN